MTSNIKVSVVVPVYNVENYLKQCLDSLVNQTLEDIEIICVNDGSTDNSLAILEEYSKKDKRIKIINQENKGLSGARNTGMRNVNGKYTFFLDSDDWIETNALEELYNFSEDRNLEITFYQTVDYIQETGQCSLEQFGGLTVVGHEFDGKIFNYEDIANILFKMPHSAFNKLYLTSFLENNNAQFPEGFNYEDVAFFYEIFPKARRASILRKPLLYYRIREDSISTSGGIKSFDIFESLKLVHNSLKDTIMLKDYLQDYLMFIIVNFKFVFLRLNKEFQNEYFNLMLENYSYFGLDKVNGDFTGWSYEDRIFYQSLDKASDGHEFDLIFERDCQAFLANHYKGLCEKLENEKQQLINEINLLKTDNSKSHSKIRNLFKK